MTLNLLWRPGEEKGSGSTSPALMRGPVWGRPQAFGRPKEPAIGIKVASRSVQWVLSPASKAALQHPTMSMIATITKQSMEGKGPLSFEQILSDPVNLNYFKNFCAPLVHTSCLIASA